MAASPGARRAAEQAARDAEEGCGADAFWRQAAWKRIAAVAAGPVMNVLVAFMLFCVCATGAPSQTPSTEVAQVARTRPLPRRAPARRPDRRGRRPAGAHLHGRLRAIGASSRPITVTVEREGRAVTLGPRRTI